MKPHRGDVFCFRTTNIHRGFVEEPETNAPFFTQTHGWIAGDVLRIDPPLLHINGKLADGDFRFQRCVMSAKFAYRGDLEGLLNVRELERQLEDALGHERESQEGRE